MVGMTRGSTFRVICVSEVWGRSLLAPATFIAFGLVLPQLVLAQDALPQGGAVVRGDVAISTPNAGHMVINQSSDRAVVNWDGFSIGHGNSVDIQQPGTSSAILNRVTGNTTSKIHGRLTATGEVYVVNPNGLIIGANGEVSAGGGFVGSSLDTSDDNFMAGRLRFEGLGNSAQVSNAGRVVVGRGGFAALLGGRVVNTGVVVVPMGRVGFGAGERATLDFSGDKFLQIEVPSVGDTDEMRALIENSGVVSAEGGSIEMRAATARNAARHAINLSGVAEASSVSVRGGTIVLGGGAGGIVSVSGRVSARSRGTSRPVTGPAQSRRPRERGNGGGDITIVGRDIALNGAEIDASGVGGGGVIRIGGDYQGGGVLSHALHLGVDAKTVITANAGETGDGGTVILWSDVHTDFSGGISARGGSQSGDGGLVEVSGKKTLAFSGLVDTSAANGAYGTLLLDPYNVTIGDAATLGGTLTATDFTPSADDSTVLVTDLETNLSLNNVVVNTGVAEVGTQDGDITVASQIDWTAPTTLTLEAIGNVILNAGINAPAGGLTIDAGDTITTSAAGTVNVDTFSLLRGAWSQVNDPLPTFNAIDFQLANAFDTSFLRALSGAGTTGDPYLLDDIYGVQGIGSGGLTNQSFALAGDIAALGTENWNAASGFTAIEGPSSSPFSGSFDGRGYSINDLTVSGQGLFASAIGASITDLGLTGVTVDGSSDVGALVGYAEDTTIDNIVVTGTVSSIGAQNIGGLVGDMTGSAATLSNSSFTGTVTSNNSSDSTLRQGGLVGRNAVGIVSNSVFSGTVSEIGDTTANRNLGGAVGYNGGSMDGVSVSGSVTTDGTGGTLFIGGLAGQNTSPEGITNSISTASVDVVSNGNEDIYAGGLVGNNFGTVTISDATGDVTVGLRDEILGVGDLYVGGLIGYNENSSGSDVDTVSASGAVTVEYYAETEVGSFADVGGLVGSNYGPISNAAASGNVTVITELVSSYVGGFVGFNSDFSEGGGVGDITAAMATGDVNLDTDLDAQVGGFAGSNLATISDAFAGGDVTLTMPSFGGEAPDFDSNVGGFSGENQGSLIRTAARGTVSGQTNQVALNVGGHTGWNEVGIILDSYANGDISGTSDAGKNVGGLVGRTTEGSITNTYSSGAVSSGGTGAALVGGLIGFSDPATSLPQTVVSASYWDTDTSGQADLGDPTLGMGLTTSDFEDTDTFYADVLSDGWDFDTVWAPGASGRYPTIYTIDRVVFARPDPLALTYGATLTAMATGSIFGGPLDYIFAESGETLDVAPIFETLTFADPTVGTRDFTVDTTPLTSSAAHSFAVVALTGSAEITPAPLELTANDLIKTYGETLLFDGTEFAITGGALFFSDTVETIAISSTGAAATANVAASPYAITGAAPVTGTGTGNYDITFVDGALSVQPAPLELTANDAIKTYGETLLFDGTEFAITGGALFFSDTVETIAISSAGVAADADVAASPYSITGAGPAVGIGAGNYDITYVDGALSVQPASLTITPDDQEKTEGNTFVFAGTEFTTRGLLFSDTVESVVLASYGAPADALPKNSPYEIFASNASGADVANYDITFETGALTVVEAAAEPPNFVSETNPSFDLPNPRDVFLVNLTNEGSDSTASTGDGSGGSESTVATNMARETLALVQELATTLELATRACDESSDDVDRYLACLSDVLDDFADELDLIAADLPPGMENVASIVRDARQGVSQARSRAQSRLANATTDAEREQIRRDAVGEARAALDTASSEIRKAITFVRADDPELASMQTATINTVAAALDNVSIELSRATGL